MIKDRARLIIRLIYYENSVTFQTIIKNYRIDLSHSLYKNKYNFL